MLTTIQKHRIDLLFILLIIAIGSLGIFYRLDVTPPAIYPWSDESDVASDAVISVREGLQFHYPAQLAGGPVAVWLEAGWIILFGPSLTGLRVLNGLVNLTSVVLLYLLVRQLPFRIPADLPQPALPFNYWLALTSALLLANSTWILGLARIATPNWSLVPPATTLTFYFFWLALKTNNRRYFVATGVMMGWAIYNYIPAYFIPLVPTIFLGILWRKNGWTLPHRPSKLYLLPFPVAFVTALPILTFFVLHPVAVMQRVVQLVHTNEISKLDLMLVGVFDTFSSFGILPNWILQGRFEHVAFDPFLVPLFIIGLIIAFRRRHDPVYSFLLIWWVVMIMPAFFSRSASLGFIFEMWRRGIGAQPVSFVFPALTVIAAAHWLQQRIRLSTMGLDRRRFVMLQSAILATLIAVTVIISSGWSYWLYFERWANSGVVPLFFAAGPVNLVEWMKRESDADTLFVFPGRSNVSPTTRPELFTVRYLYDGNAATAFPRVDEATLDWELTELFDQYQPAVVHLMMHDRIVVDPKDYFEHALGWRGEAVAFTKQPDYNVITYQTYGETALESAVESQGGVWFQAVNIDFGGKIAIIGQRLQPDRLLASRSLAVAVRVRKLTGDQTIDHNVSLALYNARNDEVSRADKPLLSPVNYLTTSHWRPGDESTIYYLLSVPPDTPPGAYTLRAVAYSPKDGERLGPVGGLADLSYTLADIQLWPNPSPVDLESLAFGQPIDVQVADGLRLVGVDVDHRVYQPGDSVRIAVLWQTTASLPRELGVGLALRPPDGASIPLFESAQPLIVDYPTTAWPAQAVYRTTYAGRLPASLTGSDYRLALQLFDRDAASLIREQVLLPISVIGREHKFEAARLANGLGVDFGDAVRLMGYEFGSESNALPGQEIHLKLQWQALREMSNSYKVFLHLIDSAGQIIDQVDTVPSQGSLPTTGWVAAEIIEDELILTVPVHRAADTYSLVIGLYNEESGERLTVGQNDHFVLVKNVNLQSTEPGFSKGKK